MGNRARHSKFQLLGTCFRGPNTTLLRNRYLRAGVLPCCSLCLDIPWTFLCSTVGRAGQAAGRHQNGRTFKGAGKSPSEQRAWKCQRWHNQGGNSSRCRNSQKDSSPIRKKLAGSGSLIGMVQGELLSPRVAFDFGTFSFRVHFSMRNSRTQRCKREKRRRKIARRLARKASTVSGR